MGETLSDLPRHLVDPLNGPRLGDLACLSQADKGSIGLLARVATEDLEEIVPFLLSVIPTTRRKGSLVPLVLCGTHVLEGEH
jgi:hypothetical protein